MSQRRRRSSRSGRSASPRRRDSRDSQPRSKRSREKHERTSSRRDSGGKSGRSSSNRPSSSKKGRDRSPEPKPTETSPEKELRDRSDSYGNDRWRASSVSPVAFRSSVKEPTEEEKAAAEAKLKDGEKRTEIKAEIKALKAEKQKYERENERCTKTTSSLDAERAKLAEELKAVTQDFSAASKKVESLERQDAETRKYVEKQEKELSEFSAKSTPDMSISQLNVLQTAKICLLDKIYERAASQNTETMQLAEKAKTQLERKAVELEMANQKSIVAAAQVEVAHADLQEVQRVSNTFQAKTLEMAKENFQIKLELKKQISGKMICLQCEARTRSVLLQPCGHLAICNGPFCREVTACPICRGAVESRQLIRLA